MLALSSIPLHARKRDDSHPFVIAGGPCTFNPEPAADFFDAMVIGDGEDVFIDMAEAWLEWKDGGGDRQGLLEKWSHLQGVYVPSFFEAHWSRDGSQGLTPRYPRYPTVRKAIVSDLNVSAYPNRPVVAFGKPIHDRLSLEICRGCTRGCRFCQAGMIYRPVRERACEKLLSLAEQALASTGYDDLSLLSLSSGDYGPLEALVERLMARCEPERIAVSLPSLRVGSLTEPLMAQIKRVRKTGFTVAPEAGSQRLRDVINKNITEEALLETLQNAFGLGWQLVKLYFMIGLPTETKGDLDAIVDLAKRLRRIRVPAGGNYRITVSVSTFVPKAHTPFQWCRQLSLAESRDRIFMLRDRVKGKGLRFKWQNPEMSILEGLWARGDRRLSPLLVKAYEMGCRFDGWSDHFQYRRWQEAIEASGIDIGFFLGDRDLSGPLPWDHVDSGVSKEFLQQEWNNALAGAQTPDCRHGTCHQCGVCDFETVKPIAFERGRDRPGGPGAQKVLQKGTFKKLRLSYSKQGPAKHFGHLEMVKTLMRAFRRARIPLRFSEGFHPAPKASFDTALPVGTESAEEFFSVEVPLHVHPASLVERVNKELPPGLSLTGASPTLGRSPARMPEVNYYTVTLKEGSFAETKLKDFMERPTWVMARTNKKGRVKTFDLKRVVVNLAIVSDRTIEMTLDFSSGGHVRPAEVVDQIFCVPQRALKLATIMKEPVRNGSTLPKDPILNHKRQEKKGSCL
jgi:radical SAM family uncharacterized protein/radical SAM-linked protein